MKISVAAQHKWLTTEYQENAFSQSQPYPTIKSRVCTFCKRPERAHARSRRALLVSHDDMHPVSSSYPVLYCSLPFPAYDAPDSSAYFICQNEVCMQFHRVPKSEREREREREEEGAKKVSLRYSPGEAWHFPSHSILQATGHRRKATELRFKTENRFRELALLHSYTQSKITSLYTGLHDKACP